MKKAEVHVLVVAGTRPEAIKLAPVILALEKDERFYATLCTTGQHRDLVTQAFGLFDIVADVKLDVMQPGQSLNSLASRTIEALDKAMPEYAPDWVMVQGDTTSAFAGALAGFHLGYRIAHVEAGLRSRDLANPFPEEGNRKIVSCIADLHLAPTPEAQCNLLAEGVRPDCIAMTGNTVVDAVNWVAAQVTAAGIRSRFARQQGLRRILLTVHRRENQGEPLQRVTAAVTRLAEKYQGKLEFIIPVHPNPNVRRVIERRLSDRAGITLVPALPYNELVEVLVSTDLVLTDSGGIQEEAPGLAKPVLVLRETTERPEGVEAGVARLIGTDTDVIVDSVSELLDDNEAYARMARATNPYGDGNAASRVVDALASHQSRRDRP